MSEPFETNVPPLRERKEWVTPELIVEDVKAVTKGGGVVEVAGAEDVEGSYYESVNT